MLLIVSQKRGNQKATIDLTFWKEKTKLRKRKYFSILLIITILFSTFNLPIYANAVVPINSCESTNAFEGATKVAVDISNNVYVFNKGNKTIKKMDASGVIDTLVDELQVDNMGAFVADTQGNIYYTKLYNNGGAKSDIVKIDNTGQSTTLATINISQRTLGVDANGNVYYSSFYMDNPNLHKIDANGNHSLVSGYTQPTTGVVSDVQGNVYLLSNGKYTKIYKDGQTSTVTAQLSYDSSNGLAIDSSSFLYTPGDSDNTSDGVKRVKNGAGEQLFSEFLKDTSSVSIDNDDNFYIVAQYTEDTSDFPVVVQVTPTETTVLGVKPPQDQAPVLITGLENNKTFNVNDQVQFSVQAQSCSNNFTYQWFKGDVAIPDAIESTYTIEAAQELDTGEYKVVISNKAGQVTSSANLTVTPQTTSGNNQPSTDPGPTISLEPFEIINANKPWGTTIVGTDLYFVEMRTRNLVKVSLVDNTKKIIKTGISSDRFLTGIAIDNDDVYISTDTTLYKGQLSELENGDTSLLVAIKKLKTPGNDFIEIDGMTINNQQKVLYFTTLNTNGKIYQIPLNELESDASEIVGEPWFVNSVSPDYYKGLTYYKGNVYGVGMRYHGANHYFYKLTINDDGTAGSTVDLGNIPSPSTQIFLAGAPAITEEGKVYISNMLSLELTTPPAPPVTADDDANVIIGADDTMEYSVDNGTNWIPYNETPIPTFEGNQTVLVRVQAVYEVSHASLATPLTFTSNNNGGSNNQPPMELGPYEVIKANEPLGITIDGSNLYFIEMATSNIIKVSLSDNSRKTIQTGIDPTLIRLTGIAIKGDDVYLSTFRTIYKGKLSELENGDSSSLEVVKTFNDSEILDITIDSQNEMFYFTDQHRGKIYRVPLDQLDEIDSSILENPWFDINPNSPKRYLRGISYYKGSIYGVSWNYDGGVYFYQVPILADGKAGNVVNIKDLPKSYEGSNSYLAGGPAIDENGKVYITDMRSTFAMTTPPAPPVTADDMNNVILDADTTMEYSVDNKSTWTSYSDIIVPKFPGDKVVFVRYKEVAGVSYASPSTTLTFTPNPVPTPNPLPGTTPNPIPTPTPDSTPDPAPSPSPSPTTGNGSSTEIITVDVDGENGELLNKTPIQRTTETNGSVKDFVTMPDTIAKETVLKAKESKNDTARIMIPDAKDIVSETKVEVPKSALSELKSGNLNLEIYTDNVTISIPKLSLVDYTDDLYFRLVPIKKEEERQQVEERAKKEEVVKAALGDGSIEVVGRPMTIETNLASRKVDLILPLQGVTLPEDPKEREDYLNNLGIFIEHSDGDRVLVRPVPVEYKEGVQGLKFTIEKFSTFTIVKMDNLDEYFNGLDKDGSKKHTPYIYGFEDGTFRTDAFITRSQMAAMLARNLEDIEANNLQFFKDVSQKNWAYNDILETTNAGIMFGVGSEQFDPKGFVTRAQMASIAYRWMQQECAKDTNAYENCSTLNGFGPANYKDVSNNHWAKEAIDFLKTTDIMIGYNDQTFKPNQKLTRAEAVKVLNRLFKRGPLTGVETPTFKDVSSSYWAFKEIEEAAREHTFTMNQNGHEVLK